MQIGEYYSVIAKRNGFYSLVRVHLDLGDGRYGARVIEGQFAGGETVIDADDLIIPATAALEVFDAE